MAIGSAILTRVGLATGLRSGCRQDVSIDVAISYVTNQSLPLPLSLTVDTFMFDSGDSASRSDLEAVSGFMLQESRMDSSLQCVWASPMMRECTGAIYPNDSCAE